MKNVTFKEILIGAFTFFLSFSIGSDLFAQGVKINSSDRPFLYLSTAYASTSSFSQGTNDPFYSGSHQSYASNTVRADLGLQLNRNLAFELGYIRTPLWLTKKITVGDLPVSNGGGVSYTRVSFYSFKLKHSSPVFHKNILFKTGLGYALGVSNVNIGKLGPSEPKTTTVNENVIVSSSTITDLHQGSTHFMTFDVGLEWAIHRKFSVFSGASLYRGFTDIQQEEIEYNINGTKGSFTTTTDGSFYAFEAGIKYNFR